MTDTFYDYDMAALPDGSTVYKLRGKPLTGLRRCHIVSAGASGWTRMTQWDSKSGRRYEWFPELDKALASGIKWARHREREELRR